MYNKNIIINTKEGNCVMKKFISFCLIVAMLCTSFVFNYAFAADDIKVTINGVEQKYDVMPVIVDGRTLVPMRGIFEALGAKVGWIDHSKTVTGTRNNKTVKLRIDDNMAYIDGQETILDVPATIINSRTMVPVRFISEMLGEKVEWDGNTKTVMIDSDYVRQVAIQPGLAPLTNNMHRDIQREFTSSSSFDDITYYTHEKTEVEYKELPSDGKVIANLDSLISSKSKNEDYGIIEAATIDGEKAAKITVKQNMDNTSKCIFKHAKLEGFKEGDTLVVSFDVKVANPTADFNIIQLQLEETTSGKYLKNIWETILIDQEWKSYIYAIPAKDGYNEFGIRPGYSACDVYIKNFKITNYEDKIKPENIKMNTNDYEESKKLVKLGLIQATAAPFDETYAEEYSSKDAQWRKDAFDRIEKYRKGDFKVVVKDKNGNIIPDADVKFSMFETEYRIGTAIDGYLAGTPELREKLNKYFNTVVNEHNMKWGPYEQNPKEARKQIDAAKKLGMKHIRGHAFVWEKPIGSDGKTPLVAPQALKEDGTVIDDKEQLQKYIKEWIYRLADDYAGEIDEWDVVNEIATKDAFRKVHGDDMMDDWFKWADEATTDSLLFYNDFAHSYVNAIPTETYGDIYKKMVNYAKSFTDRKIPVDAVGFQAHEVYKTYGKFWFDNPEEIYNMFKTFTDMGLKTHVTEYSHNTTNEIFQAEYLRDYFIVAFSVPENIGFTFWEFWNKISYAEVCPIFTEDWQLRKAGEQLIDLMYNKFWTHDTTVKTNSDGVASIRGFYGDYDVTVTHNGVSKTLSCAYHNGYDNVLEFVID